MYPETRCVAQVFHERSNQWCCRALKLGIPLPHEAAPSAWYLARIVRFPFASGVFYKWPN